jgi:hypothetical protein
MNASEINQKFAEIEKRLTEIENAIFTKKVVIYKYDGLVGGIQLLIDNNFFNKERAVKEVIFELKREGYGYSPESIAKSLSRDFVHTKRKLTRLKNGRNYKYMIRK